MNHQAITSIKSMISTTVGSLTTWIVAMLATRYTVLVVSQRNTAEKLPHGLKI